MNIWQHVKIKKKTTEFFFSSKFCGVILWHPLQRQTSTNHLRNLSSGGEKSNGEMCCLLFNSKHLRSKTCVNTVWDYLNYTNEFVEPKTRCEINDNFKNCQTLFEDKIPQWTTEIFTKKAQWQLNRVIDSFPYL